MKNMTTTSSRRARRASRGFTLMEVLMAILILMIVVPSLMRAYSMCSDVAGLTRYALAHRIVDFTPEPDSALK